MNHKRAFLIQLLIGVAVSLLATALTAWATGPTTWLAGFGWMVFFLSLQTSFLLDAARRGVVDDCSQWIYRKLLKAAGRA